ncbi:MAG TPA: helix-turn-helix domain-containing protein [Variovorax sp.]
MGKYRQVLSLPAQLGPILRSARIEAGLNQADLATKVALSQKRISSLELAPGSMNLDQLLAITAELGLELIVQSRGTDAPRSEW